MDSVLVVEDSHVIRRLVEVVLEQVQLKVVTVSSGQEACEALEVDPPDVLILDIGLPDMPGWEVLDFVRSRPELDRVSVVMMTGHGGPDEIEKAESMGADAYLMKPFRPDELRRVVVDTIHRSAQATA